MKIGSEIKKLRELREFTQQELGRQSDLTRNYIALVEADKKQPSLSALDRISEALNVHPSSLLGKDERIEQIRKRIAEKYRGLSNVEEILKEIV